MLNEAEYVRLRDTLVIDRNALDDALMNLPMDQMEIAEFTSEAAAVRDQVKFQYDQVVADMAIQMRQANDGISEARIKSEMPLYEPVVDAGNLLWEAERDYSLWKGLADAMRTKGTSIRALTDLIAAGYMTTDTIRNDNREVLHQYRMQQSG